MRIGLISQWYEPEPGAAAHPTAVARALRKRGHEVTVLTGFPNYPLGAAYPGYQQRWRSTQVLDGIRVHRVPSYLSHDSSAARRAVSLTSFAASASAQVAALRQVDVCLVYASPLTAALPALALKTFAKVPYVLYIQDLWPDTVMASGFIRNARLAEYAERFLHRGCAVAYRGAESLAVIAPSMGVVLESRGVAPESIGVVYNWVDEDVFRPATPDRALQQDLKARAPFTLMYAGAVGDIQAIDTAIRALHIIGPEAGVHLCIVGDGVATSRLERLATDLGVGAQVSFHAPRPLADMSHVLAAADAQLVTLKDLPLFEATIPSKTQAILACGQPVVVAAPGDAARLAASSKAALTVPPEHPGELAAAIREMQRLTPAKRREMGAAGREFYERELCEAVGAQRLETLLESAALPKAPRQ